MLVWGRRARLESSTISRDRRDYLGRSFWVLKLSLSDTSRKCGPYLMKRVLTLERLSPKNLVPGLQSCS